MRWSGLGYPKKGKNMKSLRIASCADAPRGVEFPQMLCWVRIGKIWSQMAVAKYIHTWCNPLLNKFISSSFPLQRKQRVANYFPQNNVLRYGFCRYDFAQGSSDGRGQTASGLYCNGSLCTSGTGAPAVASMKPHSASHKAESIRSQSWNKV